MKLFMTYPTIFLECSNQGKCIYLLKYLSLFMREVFKIAARIYLMCVCVEVVVVLCATVHL